MISSDPLFHKPKDIIAAKNILYATMFLGLVNWIIGELTTGSSNYSITQSVITIVVTLLIVFILTKQIGLGRKWARTVILILFIIGILLLPFTIVTLFKANILVGMIYILEAILEILVLKFLFSQESTLWFNRIRSTDQNPTHTS